MITIDISYYSFNQEFIKHVDSFINELKTFSNIEIETNSVSTQIFGEYEKAMNAFNITLKNHFNLFQNSAVVVKILNCDARTLLNGIY